MNRDKFDGHLLPRDFPEGAIILRADEEFSDGSYWAFYQSYCGRQFIANVRFRADFSHAYCTKCLKRTRLTFNITINKYKKFKLKLA